MQMQNLTYCTVNLTQGVKINSKDSWQDEVSPYLRKLSLREYIIYSLNIIVLSAQLLTVFKIGWGKGTMDKFVFHCKIN